jgi:hypothetical protein
MATSRANPGEHGVMTGDNEPTPLFGDVAGDQCDRDLDIDEVTTRRTEHMIVTIFSTVVSARLVGKRQLLDQPMLRQKMKRSVDGAVRDLRVLTANPLEDFPGSQVPFGGLDFGEDHGPLSRLPVRSVPRGGYRSACSLLIHDLRHQLRMSLVTERNDTASSLLRQARVDLQTRCTCRSDRSCWDP